MASRAKDLQKLLELKKSEEKTTLDTENAQTLFKLKAQYLDYATMTHQAMLEKLQQEASTKEVGVECSEDVSNAILNEYRARYRNTDWYKEPEIKDGKISITFPSEIEMGNFFKDQAEQNRSFIVVDGNTNQVIAYSNGDGKLYHGNGSEYDGGDFQRSAGTLADFKMPSPTNGAGMGR